MSKRRSNRVAEATEAKKKKTESRLDFEASWNWYNPRSKKDGPLVYDDPTTIAPVIQLTGPGIPSSKKIAGFDIDSTLIVTKSGRKFATGISDWQWWSDEVPQKLKEAHDEGYKVVFFTNQAGIEKRHVTPKDICRKCENIISKLGFPVQVFMCTGQNQFRKPSRSIFDHLEQHCNDGITIDVKKSYYVGDAAGRKKEWAPGKPRDFSCSDRMFAANCKLKFFTPEEYFHGDERVSFEWRSINPSKELTKAKDKTADDSYHSKKQELIISVGCPAAGKSTFSKNYLAPHGYEIVNRDTLGTQSKCQKAAVEALKSGKSVVIDNTNPAKYTRLDYIKLAEKYGVPVRCFWFETPFPLAHHMNLYRQNLTNGQVRRVPDVGFNMFKKYFEEPELTEGFKEIKKIDFIPKFANNKDEELFLQWTC